MRYVYLMHDPRTKYYKIGYSKNPNLRLVYLREDVPFIQLIHASPKRFYKHQEKLLHSRFESKRKIHPIYHSGYTEWFKLNEKDVDKCIRLMDSYEHRKWLFYLIFIILLFLFI